MSGSETPTSPVVEAPADVEQEVHQRALLARDLFDQWCGEVQAGEPCQPFADDRYNQGETYLQGLRAAYADAMERGDLNGATSITCGLRARIRAAARVEVGLPEKGPWEAYMDKLKKKAEGRRTASGRKAR